MLQVTGLHKQYGGVTALQGVSLAVRDGTVHALVGANGSGKTTLLRVLSGQVLPDAGSVTVDGRALPPGRPLATASAGIAIVTQEPSLVEHLSVGENIMLGPFKRGGRLHIDWRATHAHARTLLAGLGADLDTHRRVGDLRADERQLVAVARAVGRSARLLVLDEPTSSLTRDEVTGLMTAIRSLRARGVASIFVSHRLAEIFDIADDITVLRGGRAVMGGPMSMQTPAEVVAAMTGREAASQTPGRLPQRPGFPVALRINGLRATGNSAGTDLRVGSGEILGLAGLTGSGRGELLEVLFGVRRPVTGEIVFHGEQLMARSPREAIAAGIGFVGADRVASGLVQTMSVDENIMMVGTLARGRWRRAGRAIERYAAGEAARAVGLADHAGHVNAGALSGGNQQKIVLAKWLAMRPRLLLLDDPTRGIDVAARAEIHTLLRHARSSGLTILLSSSEVPELLELCDRIAVMVRGRVRAVLPAGTASERGIVELASAGT